MRACVRKGKGKALLVQAWTSPEGSRSLRLPDFKKIFIITTELNPISHLLALLEARPKVHISRIKVKVVRLSALRTSHLYTQEIFLYSFLLEVIP